MKYKHIAVISLSTLHFGEFISSLGIKYNRASIPRKVKHRASIYYCIIKPHDLCSIPITGVLELNNSNKNTDYIEIKSTINTKLTNIHDNGK